MGRLTVTEGTAWPSGVPYWLVQIPVGGFSDGSVECARCVVEVAGFVAFKGIASRYCAAGMHLTEQPASEKGIVREAGRPAIAQLGEDALQGAESIALRLN